MAHVPSSSPILAEMQILGKNRSRMGPTSSHVISLPTPSEGGTQSSSCAGTFRVERRQSNEAATSIVDEAKTAGSFQLQNWLVFVNI